MARREDVNATDTKPSILSEVLPHWLMELSYLSEQSETSDVGKSWTEPTSERCVPLTHLLDLVSTASSDRPVKSAERKRRLSRWEYNPVKKRAKIAQAENPIEKLRKHERFWLPDGNVVIELDDIRFRVHRSWLAQHSKRIAASLPSKSKDGGQFEKITLDFRGKLKAKDFETLLLLYDNPG
jgi:hypothetical protein